MVSVLLATYNGKAHLPALLHSLDNQTLPSFRVLWQDDGSTDGTPTLLHACASPRYQPGRDQGQRLRAIGNFLSLMAQDTAPYTALCDQDDVWHAEKLSCCLAALQAAEALHGPHTPLLVHTDSRVVDAHGQPLHGSLFAHQGWDGSANTLAQLLVQNNVTGCTVLMNAALRKLVTAHAKAEQLHMHDWFIALTAAAFGQIIFVNEPLMDYRQHGANVMGASRYSLMRRALSALTMPGKAQDRIRLTYRHAQMFLDAYGPALPGEARRIINGYLSTAHQPKLQRIASLQRGGYLMQSRTARLGQIIFG